MAHGRFDNPIVATLAGVKDFFKKQDLTHHFKDSDQIEGKTCLVTGANSGLGFAVSVELAKRGGKVITACRRQIEASQEKVKVESGCSQVYGKYLDLSKIETIHDFVDGMKNENIKFDILILNAGVALPKARKTDCGLEEMFLVNYLSNFILLNLLLKAKLIGNGISIPRIIFISSDSHNGSSYIDFDEFGKYFDYGVSTGTHDIRELDERFVS